MAQHDTPSLSPRELRFVMALLECGGNVTRAAQRAQISPRTAFRYLKRPSVQQAISDGSRQLLESLHLELLVTSRTAMSALREILESGDASARVKAAGTVLNSVVRSAQLVELLPRLLEIEQRLASLPYSRARGRML